MKFIIVFACLLAIAAAGDEQSKILKFNSDVNHDSFNYEFETDNSIKAQQEGQLIGGKDKDEGNWVVKGEYEFADPHGQVVKVSYVADENGYQPKVHQ